MKRKVEVLATGVQSFEQRFPGKRRRLDEGLPTISPWACNLTGLSQQHNLYFIAYGGDVFVYEPTFPAQHLGEPVLVIPSHPSSDGLRGYIRPNEPHHVNNLVVASLGREEIVATVRDDGDVDAILVRHIVQAIERRLQPGNTIGKTADELRPIFQSNVGISAWGLAVHTRARIIAVSSNNHEVTVFKFALLDEYDPADEDETQQDVPNGRHRKTDVTHQVLNGEANIPHIAFCNTGDDPKARWLLTTDISGVCRVLDLHSVLPVQAFRFGPALLQALQQGFDRGNAGWGVMFLDRRSFQAETDVNTALGMEPDEQLPDARSNPHLWDLSKTAHRPPHTSAPFGLNNVKPISRERRPALPTTLNSDYEERPPVTGQSTSNHVEEEAIMVDTENTEDDASEMSIDTLYHDGEGLSDVEDEGTEDTISPGSIYNGSRICGNFPQFARHTNLCCDLPCPILHTSIRNIYMLQPSNQKCTPGAFCPPVVGFASPLRQAIHFNYRTLNLFDRLNMHAYIPSIGIVVLASQKGRALILSLTKLPRSVRYPAEMRGMDRKTTYAMRIQSIVPFASQEEVNARPLAPLHGIAVGPIQGTEDLPDEMKRWRLMLMYQDHAVLSYEIASRRDENVDVGSESLIV